MKFQQPTNLHFTQGRAIINTTTKILKAAVATLEENEHTHTHTNCSTRYEQNAGLLFATYYGFFYKLSSTSQ